MSQVKPTYKELEQRCRAAESALAAIRSGQADTVVGEKGVLVLQLIEIEKALQEAELKYRTLAENSPDIIYIIDLTKNKSGYLNRETLLGYTLEELEKPGESLLSKVHPDDLHAVQVHWQESLAGRTHAELEYRLQLKDGRWEWLHSRPRILSWNMEGKPTQLLVTLSIITARKQAEKRLHSLLEISQALTQSLDLTTVLQQIVDNITQVTALDSGAIYTLADSQIYLAATTPALPPEFPDQFRLASLADHPHIRTALAKGAPIVIADTETAELTAAEREVSAARGLRSIAYLPLMNARKAVGVLIAASTHKLRTFTEEELLLYTGFSGQAAQIIEYLQLYASVKKHALELEEEITERKQAEDKLRKSEEQYRLLFEAASDGVVLHLLSTDRTQNHFRRFNQNICQMLGYTAAEMAQLGPMDIQPAAELMHVPEEAEHMELKRELRFEKLFCRKDGTLFPADVHSSVFELDGELLVLSIIRDISERKQAEENLRASEGKFRTLVDQSADGVFLMNEMGKILEWNSREAHITGISRAQALGSYAWDIQYRIIPPERRSLYSPERLKAGFLAGFLTEKSPNLGKPVDIEIVSATGERKFIQQTTFLVDGQSEKRLGAIVRDITEQKRAEQKLRESEERFRTVADFTYDWEYWLDENQQLVYISPSCEYITGYTRDHFLKDRELLQRIVYPDDREIYEAHLHEEFHHMDGKALDFRIITANGEVRWVGHTCRGVVDQNGLKRGRRVSNRDITERKQAEEALRRYAMAIEQSNDGIAIADTESRMTFVNHAWAEMHGYQVQDMLGQPLSMNHTAVQLERDVIPFIEKVQEKGQHHGEVGHLRKDGFTFPTQMSTTLLKDEKGLPVGLLGIARDITERKQAEEKLHESEEKYRSLLESLDSIVATVDVNGKFLYMNDTASEQLGGSPDQFIGKTMYELFPPHIAQLQMADILLVIASDQGKTFENPSFIGGQLRWYSTSIQPLHNEAGQVKAALINSTDIHELKVMQQELQELNQSLEQRVEERTAEVRQINQDLERAMRVKDEFLANMSHELRTPLSAIIGLSESLLDNSELNARQQKYINTINESGQHLLTLINDVLDLAKIGAGQITLEQSIIDVNSVCQSSLRMIKQLSQKKVLQVHFDIDTNVEFIIADERRLKQMIVNLLSNAVKFTPANGQIGLEVHGDQTNHMVQFIVWDTGVGISKEDQARLFQPFTQVNPSLIRENGGTGLGLALVDQMARLHGGYVSLKSEPGKGSQFAFALPWEQNSLPAVASSTLTTPSREAIKATTASGRKQVIVLFEDTDAVIMTIRDYLEYAGYQVETARNGQDGLDLVKQIKPDLILMDIQMPVMDGLEATRRLRSQAEFQNTPIIALTAFAMSGDRERCIKAGATDYLSKPVKLKELIAKIKEALPL